MYIFLGSTNPVKINAVINAASEKWPDVTVKGFEVNSGVSNQPMSDDETKQGAKNRAVAAFQMGLREFPEEKESVAIGMEGGVCELENGEMWNTVWAYVVDREGNAVYANGERFLLPEILAMQIRDGKEMGPAMDEIAGTKNIKQQGGMIGIITDSYIDRTELYAHLAKLALGLWYGRNWHEKLTHS